MIGVGQATGVVKPLPIDVNTGSKVLGLHAGDALGEAAPDGPDGDPVVTSRRSTVCVVLSVNVSVIDPRKTEAFNPVRVGVTVMVTLWPGPIPEAFGAKVNQFGVAEAVALNPMTFEVRFVTVNDCGFTIAPGADRNTRPLGETAGAADVPAGTMFNTTLIDTGGCLPSVGVSVTEP